MRAPNVVVFLTDQQRWDSTGLQGNPLALTPNFDRLARKGAHLRHCFSCQPLCVPARGCLQTGMYPTSTGTHVNGRHLAPQARTLAHCFADAGYRTAYIGKWHLAPSAFTGAVPPEYRGGYQDWLAANVLELVSDAYNCRLWDETGKERPLPGYRVDAVANSAVEYIRRRHPRPFLLFLSFLEPHQQNSRDDFPAPRGYAARYLDRWIPPDLATLGLAGRRQLAGYWGMVKRLDEALGRVCQALERRGLWDNTLLLFTSDHGCHFKTRNAEYKRSCHESSIRVPAFIHGPGFAAAGDRSELVSLIDLPPTLLDAAGLPIPPEMAGRSLVPRIRYGRPWRDEIFIQISESQNARALRTPRWKYSMSAAGTDFVQARKAPSWPLYEENCLYDLAGDPWEQHNLAGDPAYADVAGILRGRLLARMAEAGEQPPAVIAAAPR